MRPPRLGLLCAFVGGVAWAGAASFDARVEVLFRPPLGEMIALSPDGQRVAYTAQAGPELSLILMNIEGPGGKTTVNLAPARDSATVAGEAAPVRLRYLRWATGRQLIYAPEERVVPLPPIVDKQGRATPNPDGPTIVAPILLVDLDGKQRGTLIDAVHFQETPADARKSLADFLRTTKELVATRNEPVRWRMPHLDILGFLPREREQLIVQTRGAYSQPAQHLVDIRTGSVREFGNEWPAPPGAPYVFDGFRLRVVGERKEAARPTTVWQDEELQRVQQELETKFPRRAVEILDWSETRARVLVRVTGGSDAGRLFVHQRPEDLVLEILRCAPWLSAGKLHETRFFECTAPDGAPLTGYVTWPGKPRGTPPPVVMVFPSGFPGWAQPAFDPEAQVLADLGLVVVRLNHRGVAGVRSRDLDRLRAAVDRVAVDDAQTVLAWLAARQPARAFDAKRVASFGRGFGGYLAVRALQLEPTTFRGGIAIDAPLELRPWLQTPGRREVPVALIEHDGAAWKTLSVLDQAEALTRPVLLLVEPGRSVAIDTATTELRARGQRLGRTIDHAALAAGFSEGRPAARAAAYRRMEEFIGLYLHDHAMQHGPAKEVE